MAMENNYIMLNISNNISDNQNEVQVFQDGWSWNDANNSFYSAGQQQSDLIIQRNGTFDISFRYKMSTQEFGKGIIQFQIDGVPKNIRNEVEWNHFSMSVQGNHSHELKWIVHKGQNPFVVWIDSISINDTEYILAPSNITRNQIPFIGNLKPNRESPQEPGSIVIWAAEATDPENDQLVYEFYLNGSSKTGWIKENTWEWHTTKDNSGVNRIEVRIRDEKHSGADGFDRIYQTNFTIEKAEYPIAINNDTETVNESNYRDADIENKTEERVDIAPKNPVNDSQGQNENGTMEVGINVSLAPPLPLIVHERVVEEIAETTTTEVAEKTTTEIAEKATTEGAEKVTKKIEEKAIKKVEEKATKKLLEKGALRIIGHGIPVVNTIFFYI
jgi:hypothetical protein